MGKKSKKNNKKGKESDGRGSSTGGGSNSNSNNNNHNNNISIPTVDDETFVATTTTRPTTILTQQDLEFIDNKFKLKGYPKSTDFVIGYKYWIGKQDDLAIASFKRGADNDGCVPCMSFYADLQRERGNLHLFVPYGLECAIRGHERCMNELIELYQKTQPVVAMALASFWAKTRTECGDTEHTEEKRKEHKKNIANMCLICGKGESEGNNDVTLVKCGICKFYSYCGKDCQTYHWTEEKHMNECRQVILLRKYCKPSYVKEIREAIIDSQDPKEIHTLQRLRMKLGLNRPKEDYEELLLRLSDDNNNNNNNNVMKRGTKVQIKGLVKSAVHNGKFGFVTSSKVGTSSIPGEEHRRVGVELLDEDGSFVVVAIKIQNLELASKYEWLVGRKDGTVHIGSTPKVI